MKIVKKIFFYLIGSGMLIYILKHEGYSNKQVFQYVSVFVIIVLLIISQIQSQRKKNNGIPPEER